MTEASISPHSSSSFCPPTSWADVYLGIETNFIDHGPILPSSSYTYRVQAWNAVGRSSWTTIEVYTPEADSRGCRRSLQNFMRRRQKPNGTDDLAIDTPGSRNSKKGSVDDDPPPSR